MILIPWGVGKREEARGERGRARQSEQSERRDCTVANGNLARGDIGIESVYARQVSAEREIGRCGIKRGGREETTRARGKR